MKTTEVACGMKIKRGPLLELSKTHYQGHTTPIISQNDIVPALHAVNANYRVARATNTTYAYRIQSGSRVLEHFEDDGDHGAGRHLLDLLREMNITNRIICVSNWGSGARLGRDRFNHVVEAARKTFQDI